MKKYAEKTDFKQTKQRRLSMGLHIILVRTAFVRKK
jgi:hypothetical protein